MRGNFYQKKCVLPILWLLEGILVGFGAILPGVSGGALCAAFGMYRPMIETLSDLQGGLKKNGKMLFLFLLGAGIGFIGLSGLAAWLLERNTTQITCLFIGFVLGILPGLWKEAGIQGRETYCYGALGGGFVGILVLLTALKNTAAITVSPDFSGFLLCGVLWGLSFIVPGLSSSTLLLFFGLYQPMLAGISSFDLRALLPLGIGMLACVLVLTRLIQSAYQKYYGLISHCILGLVAATAVAIFPFPQKGTFIRAADMAAICIGIFFSLGMTKLCDKLHNEK